MLQQREEHHSLSDVVVVLGIHILVGVHEIAELEAGIHKRPRAVVLEDREVDHSRKEVHNCLGLTLEVLEWCAEEWQCGSGSRTRMMLEVVEGVEELLVSVSLNGSGDVMGMSKAADMLKAVDMKMGVPRGLMVQVVEELVQPGLQAAFELQRRGSRQVFSAEPVQHLYGASQGVQRDIPGILQC